MPPHLLHLLLAALPGLVLGQADWDAKIYLHDPATASSLGAYCLDGSRGGFYFRPASSPSAATKWKFHFMGGGWSNNDASSLDRSTSILGSSTAWPPMLSALWAPEYAGFYGLMSANDTAVNPFGDWNFVWAAYCDGSSQTSDRTDPVKVGNKTLYYRGRALLDAHLVELERRFSFLSTATEVIISGTSAGGLSTYLHSSFIKSQLRAPGARLVAVPDAGFWWEHPQYGGGGSPWVDTIQRSIVPTMWNSTLRGGLAACLAAPPRGNPALCYSQPYAYAYQDVPTFVVQSMADPANLGYCWRPPCSLSGNSPGTCTPQEVAAILQYGSSMAGNITAAQAQFGSRDGKFLTSCQQHEETCRSFDWWGITIGGATMNSTFTAWYLGTPGVATSVVDGPWPSDATCTCVPTCSAAAPHREARACACGPTPSHPLTHTTLRIKNPLVAQVHCPPRCMLIHIATYKSPPLQERGAWYSHR